MRAVVALLALVLASCTGWMLDDLVNRPLGWKLNDPPPRQHARGEAMVCHCVPSDAGGCVAPGECGRPECGWCVSETRSP